MRVSVLLYLWIDRLKPKDEKGSFGAIVADRWAPDLAYSTMAGGTDYRFERRRLTPVRNQGLAARRPDIPQLLTSEQRPGARGTTN